MPVSNLAAAASDLALGQSVRYVHHHYRYRLGRSSYYAYGAAPPPGAGHSGIAATKSFARKQPGFIPGSGQEAEDVRCSGPARFARIREALFSDAAFAGCITAMADLQ